MSRRIQRTYALIPLGLLAMCCWSLGCRHQSVVGRWTDPLAGNNNVMDFRPDGTFEWDIGTPGSVGIFDKGTYTFDGTALVVKPTSETLVDAKHPPRNVEAEAWTATIDIQGDVMKVDDSVQGLATWHRVK